MLVQVTTAFTTETRQERGSENARSLIELGQIVFIGPRDPARGHTVADEIDAHFVQIEVINDESVAATAGHLEQHDGSSDVLINCARVDGTHGDPSERTALDVLKINLAGGARTTNCLPPAATPVSRPGKRER